MPTHKNAALSPMEVGHGCVDCASYVLPTNKPPCSKCKKWSEWKPGQKYLDRMDLRRKIELEITNRGKRK